MAHFHRQAQSLGFGHTVNFGKPWLNDSLCDHGLVSLPYLDGPILENLEIGDGQIVKFYWLIPITKSELEFKKSFGLEALEKKFEETNFNYGNPNRMPVC